MKLQKPLKDYLFVALQLLIFVAYVLPVELQKGIQLPAWLRYLGLVVFGLSVIFGIIALLQLNTKLSPFPSPVSSGKLLTQGAFKISRHPIYTALIFAGFGYATYALSIYKVVVTLFLMLLFYYKSIYEEALLSEKFSEYESYKQRTPRFI